MQRTITFDAKRAQDEAVPAIISTDDPVDMGGFVEILEHSPEAVDLSRSPLPLIESHDTSKTPVGVVESLRIVGGKLRGLVRFGKSSRARELLQDVIDGVIRSLSIGYSVANHVRQSDGSLRATQWMPYEVSIVSVPADTAAGFYRSKNMEPQITLSGDAAAAARAERDRASQILDLATRHNHRELGERAIAAGTSLAEFRGLILDKVATKPVMTLESEIGMSSREARQYSVVRAILAQADPQKFSHSAGLELEVSREMERKTGKVARGLWIPLSATRDLTTSTASGTSKAGYTVQTDVLAEQFVDVLRNRMVLNELGATFLTGLQGNVAIPRKTTGATSYWVAENSAPSEGDLVFDQITMTPKTLASFVDFSRRLMLQSSLDVEAMVRSDLATGIATTMDNAAIYSTGTNKPTGVLNTSGIGSVVLGTNGAAPTWQMAVNLVREVEIDNALNGAAAFLTNGKVRAKMFTTTKQSSGVEGNFILGPDNSLLGYPVRISNGVPSNLTKGSSSGVCSAMAFGVWSDLIVGQWSGIDLLVDPYTGSKEGTVRVVAMHDCDFGVRHPESFAACLDILTT